MAFVMFIGYSSLKPVLYQGIKISTISLKLKDHNKFSEPCRKHNLMMLRKQLENERQQWKGTRIKEIIGNWASTVRNTLHFS